MDAIGIQGACLVESL
jgi:hypothetical protein